MTSTQETTRVCLACGLQTQEELINCPNDGSLLAAGTDPLLGTTFLEKYLITDVLGRGGMSAVYKARHLMMDRMVAIKFLRSELVHDNVMLQRFQLESKAVSLLKHPNIITVHDFGLSPTGVPYLIMDFLDGKTVADIISESESIDPARCVNLFTQICNALAHTHSKGVIHRDIKPSNLIVGIGDAGEEVAQVVDFGIAKMLEREASSANKLTASGEVFGSPAFMSPEQCNGSTVDARTDIYALACVIYNCLTGRPPLLGRNAMETVIMHIKEIPKTFGEVRPDLSISPVLERVVFKALSKDPDERYATMTEFSAELAKSILESNNNTTWIIPAQAQREMQNEELAARYESTQPVIPTSNAKSDGATSAAPDAIPSASSLENSNQPETDMGRPDPIVSLKHNFPGEAESKNQGSELGKMNPNSMIVPGSDLFGYDSLMPALPDQNLKPRASDEALENRPRASANNSQLQKPQPQPPHPQRIVEDIPLAAPPKVTHKGTTPETAPIQPSRTNVSNQTSQDQISDEDKKKQLVLILTVVLVVLVVLAVAAIVIRSQS